MSLPQAKCATLKLVEWGLEIFPLLSVAWLLLIELNAGGQAGVPIAISAGIQWR